MTDHLQESERTWYKPFIYRLFVLGGIAALVYMWRPLFHSIIYPAVFNPLMVFSVGIPILLTTALFLIPKPDGHKISHTLTLAGTIFAIGIVIGLVLTVPSGLVEERALADRTMGSAIEVDNFPEVNEENPRIAPRQVADVQTAGSVSYRMHRLGPSDIARMPGGELGWSYALEPEGLRNSIYEHQRGVLMSDMTTMEHRTMIAIDDQDFTYGEGMFVHRSASWNIYKGDYWMQLNDDPIEFVHGGDAYMAYPKTAHEWRVDFVFGFIPVPYTVPVWDGVALLHTDGTVEHLTPDEAQEHTVLEGQRLYPLYLTEREVGSLGYRNGIINQLPVIGAHEGQIEVASLPSGTGNEQPFVIDLAGGQMSYVTAMEPYGEDTRGLDEVWFTNATTGEYLYYGTEAETLLGPERAMGIVRSEDTRTGWGDNFVVIEPIPVTVDGELWWHSKVTPTDYTDVSRNVFVNAHNQDAIEIHTTEEVVEFLGGADDVGRDIGDGVDVEPTPDDGEIAYYVVIYDEDGNEIERHGVKANETIEITTDSEGGDQ